MPVGTATASQPLTSAQILGYAQQAGFTGDDAKTITAIAHAESGDNPLAHNAVPPDDSYGLTQINMIGSLGPTRRQQLGIASNSALYDPATNMKAAHAIFVSAGNKFTPWSTYNNGSYKQYMTDSLSAAPGPAPSSGDAGGLSLFDKLNVFNTALRAFHDWQESIRRDSLSILVVIVALVFIVLGIIILQRKNAAKAGRAAVKVGKVVGVAAAA